MDLTIGLADDHLLFLKSLGVLINTLPGCIVTVDAVNGNELLHKLTLLTALPEIILVDVNMPIMDGVVTVQQLSLQYPLIKTVALSMKDDDYTIIRMIKAGCCAYLQKDIHPTELEIALNEIHAKGYYNADAANLNYRRLIKKAHEEEDLKINERETIFLQLACSDLTYKQIASEMHLSERTIDGYREALFQKLKVQSRVGMALEAIRRNLVIL